MNREQPISESGGGHAAVHEAIASRVRRYHQFYASSRPGDLLVVVRPRWVLKKNLFDYDFTRGGHLEMAADMLASSRALRFEMGELDDDLIPWLTTDLGIAIHHTFLADMPVTFAEWTSWADHPLAGPDGYAKLKDLRFNLENRWVKITLDMLKYWKAHNDGVCLINATLHFSPLDLANALRGNEIFTDFYDYPDEVRALLDVSTEAIIMMEEEGRKIVGDQIEQIGMPFWGAMAPPGSLYVSEDAMDMIGPELSAEWGVPWTRRIRERFGALAVHHHMLGLKVQGTIGRELRPDLLQISNDPNCPPAMQSLKALAAAAGPVPMMIDCGPDEILAHLDELRQLRAILICGCNDPVKAGKVVAAVRSVSNIR